ncbi:MAG: hypothetical protein LBG14_04605 [Treponema sp.]|jgi:hypothetical protein|nr:hypothetical protein [Treponema sp.]
MIATKELFLEIETLPKECLAEVLDFVTFLKMKHGRQNMTPVVYSDLDEGYQAMAADTEREKEAQEWINGYFGEVTDD